MSLTTTILPNILVDPCRADYVVTFCIHVLLQEVTIKKQRKQIQKKQVLKSRYRGETVIMNQLGRLITKFQCLVLNATVTKQALGCSLRACSTNASQDLTDRYRDTLREVERKNRIKPSRSYKKCLFTEYSKFKERGMGEEFFQQYQVTLQPIAAHNQIKMKVKSKLVMSPVQDCADDTLVEGLKDRLNDYDNPSRYMKKSVYN